MGWATWCGACKHCIALFITRSQQRSAVAYRGCVAISYEHLEDTDNNTFRTLRILDPSAPVGSPLRNAKYSEFVGRDDWDHKHGPLECELFNLDEDPWEMNNT